MIDVTCVGGLVADVVGTPVDGLPSRGTLALLDRIELHSGGCAANTGVGLAKLGLTSAIVGKVGRDGFGAFLRSTLAAGGALVDGIVEDPMVPTSATMVMVHSDGERTFLHCLGANAELTLNDIDVNAVLNSRVLLMAGAFLVPRLDGAPVASLLKKAQQANVITCLDTAWDATGQWMNTLAPCMPHIDFFVPSYQEAIQLLPGVVDPRELASAFREMGADCVIIKDGENGCYISEPNGSTAIVPPYSVATVDALGAGDAWVSGFLAAKLNGMPTVDAARFANAVGACCVTSLGATTGIRSYSETLEFMATTCQRAPVNAH